jgi:hypothetical protein
VGNGLSTKRRKKNNWNYSLFHAINSSEAKEGTLPKHAGAYKGEKRRKEVARQKKQEERRQRRFHKEDRTPSDAEKVEQEETKPADP